jgi:hypothetical protein
MRDFLRQNADRYPNIRDTVESILGLDAEVDRLPVTQFFEPMSFVEVADGKRTLADAVC